MWSTTWARRRWRSASSSSASSDSCCMCTTSACTASLTRMSISVWRMFFGLRCTRGDPRPALRIMAALTRVAHELNARILLRSEPAGVAAMSSTACEGGLLRDSSSAARLRCTTANSARRSATCLARSRGMLDSTCMNDMLSFMRESGSFMNEGVSDSALKMSPTESTTTVTSGIPQHHTHTQMIPIFYGKTMNNRRCREPINKNCNNDPIITVGNSNLSRSRYSPSLCRKQSCCTSGRCVRQERAWKVLSEKGAHIPPSSRLVMNFDRSVIMASATRKSATVPSRRKLSQIRRTVWNGATVQYAVRNQLSVTKDISMLLSRSVAATPGSLVAMRSNSTRWSAIAPIRVSV
eukprot:m.842979 g.842979  ORF g.842979 m.842979 type:complete len:351 (-) comp23471_c1_seq20:1773-2825(-)